MRRIKVAVVGAITLALVAMAAPAVAHHSHGQLVFGSVSAPTGPHRAGPVLVGACGLGHTAAGFVAGPVQGGLAYAFEVRRSTRGDRFEVAPFGQSDIDITFYGNETTSFTEMSTSGESGRVPDMARRAIVCLVAGGPTSVVYTAG